MQADRREENIARTVFFEILGIMILYLVLCNGSRWGNYFYYLNCTASTAGVLLAAYLIGNYIVRKNSGGSGIRRFAVFAGAFCVFLLCLHIIREIFDIYWYETMAFDLLVAAWPMLLYGLTVWLDKCFPYEKRVLKLVIYFLVVGAAIGWDIAVRSDNYSLMGGLVRPDHVLYFLIMASVIGYRIFLKGTAKKSIRIISLISFAAVIIGITAAVFYFNPRWHDVISYIIGDLTGHGSDVDWIGYRIAAFRAYWLHDFDTLRQLYAGEEYWLAVVQDGLVKLAYQYGSWTSVVFVLMETGVCAGFGILYTDIRKKGLLGTPAWRIWNAVPYLISAYIIRIVFALTENMFMLSVQKMDLPFTGISMIEILITLVFLYPWLYECEADASRQSILFGSMLGKIAIFIILTACISICFSLTQNTKNKIQRENLREQREYNYMKEEVVQGLLEEL